MTAAQDSHNQGPAPAPTDTTTTARTTTGPNTPAPTGPDTGAPNTAGPGTDAPAPTGPDTGTTAPAGPGNGSGTGTPGPSGTAPGEPPTSGPSQAQRKRRARRLLAVLAVLTAGGITLAALNSGTRHGLLDPRSADPSGSRAVAELLKDHGVTTRVVTTAREAADAAGPRTTLLVTAPDRLGTAQRNTIHSAMDLSGGRTVLLAPGGHSLPDLVPGVRTKGESDTDDLAPACTLPAATTAGRAGTGTGGGMRYTTTLPRATACYPSEGHPTLLVLPKGTTGDTVVLGSGEILLNENLAHEGNASLALQLLGSRPNLVWYMPSLADSDPADDPSDGQDKGLFDLVPSGWSWALLQLFVAAALAALWRARRLGPLVTEKLPVVIRASEATEGRARLYRKAGARDRAATVLRAAARERLAALVGVPHTQAHEPPSLVPAVSAHLTGGPARTPDVTTLLFGPTPSDDAALVALSDHLDALEREVRTS
ncbi:DUF4350 domain-containing protein [Streptomyces sp. NPDC048337]|uniref:DUF4350 domain-containing protein n=1 Tax=Streptomyces sp. NPDC048337 TaxID=3365535 RepID=UPI003720A412